MRQLHRIVVRPEMHEIKPRFLIEHVAVQRRNLNSVLTQGFDYGIDFAAKQHEIASDRGLSSSCRLEVERRSHPHRSGYFHSVFVNAFSSRNTELVNAAVIFALPPQSSVDLVGVQFYFRCCGCSARRGGTSNSERIMKAVCELGRVS